MCRAILSFLVTAFIFLFASSTSIASDLAPADYQPHLMKSEFYSEQWSLSVWAEDGTYVHVQFVISNVGIGDHKGAVKVEVTWPDGRQDGVYEQFKDNWKSAKEGFRLEFGTSVFSETDGGFHINAGNDKIKIELKTNSHAEGWHPGGSAGFMRNSDGIFDTVLLAPYMKAEGALVANGRTLKIKGEGYVDHSYSDIAPHKLAKRWLKMKFHLKDGSLLLFAGLALPGSKKDIDRSWLWFGQNGKTLFVAVNPIVKFANVKPDGVGGKYSLPEKIHLRAESGGRSFGIDLKQTAMLSHKSMLDNISKIERMVVERFADPIDYKLKGDYLIQLQEPESATEQTPATLKLKGEHVYIMQYLNP